MKSWNTQTCSAAHEIAEPVVEHAEIDHRPGLRGAAAAFCAGARLWPAFGSVLAAFWRMAAAGGRATHYGVDEIVVHVNNVVKSPGSGRRRTIRFSSL